MLYNILCLLGEIGLWWMMASERLDVIDSDVTFFPQLAPPLRCLNTNPDRDRNEIQKRNQHRL